MNHFNPIRNQNYSLFFQNSPFASSLWPLNRGLFLPRSLGPKRLHSKWATLAPKIVLYFTHRNGPIFGAKTDLQKQLDDRNNYQPLEKPMVKDTSQRVKHLINTLHNEGFIDEMTVKWFNQTPDPPRIPVFYTLTKIHKPTLVGRPIISGCDGPTERLSSFVDKLLQPIAQIQDSYLKDTTHFIRFIENTRVPSNAFLVSMDVTSLYTNIPQEEGITIVCNAYEKFHDKNPPIATHLLKEMLSLILKENSFHFNGKDYLQTHGTAMGTKMAVAFANIFMATIEKEILKQSRRKPLT